MTFYKTMFARMSNIKAEKFVDDETGESLNDVAAVLDKLGISLYTSDGTFRNFGTVLDEVGEKWDTYNNVQQAAIATAIAGTRQQEKFRVLMENYGSAMDYASIATDSAGTAMSKYNDSYMQGIEASMNSLKAGWEEFSTTILDSDLVVFLVDILSGIVKVLNAISSFGDGFVVTSLIVVSAVVLMQASISTFAKVAPAKFMQIKKAAQDFGIAMGKAFANPYTYITILISLYVSFRKKINQNTKLIIAAIGLLGTTFVAILTMVEKKIQTFMKSNWVGWILLAISAIVMGIDALVQYFKKERNKPYEELKKVKEEAEEASEVFKEAREELKELNDAIDEYKEIVGEANDFLSLSEESRKRLLELQSQINGSVLSEGTAIDSVNGKLQEQIGYLDKIAYIKAQEAIREGRRSYAAHQQVIASSFDERGYFISREGGHIDDIYSPLNWDSEGDNDIKTGYNIVFERGEDSALYADQIANIFASKKHIRVNKTGNMSGFQDMFAGNYDDLSYNIGFAPKNSLELGLSDEEYFFLLASEYDTALEEMERRGYASSKDNKTRELYNKLLNYYNINFKEPYEAMKNERGVLMENIAQSAVYETKAAGIDPKDDWEKFTAEFLKNVSEETATFGWGEEYVKQQTDTFLKQMFPEKFQEEASGTIKYEFDTILKAVQDGYDLLNDALSDIDELGIISSDTLEDLFENYPDLKKYLIETAEGYTLVEGALSSYLEGLKKIYGLGENELTWNAVLATLGATEDIEKWIESQEKVIESFEGELDAYQQLIEIRKDLLKTYKEELDYKKELEKKQKAVASLETQLALSRLDNSAAGRARTRELEKQLEEAQEELDDYTLEHAIDEITSQLDASYNEYKKFIDEKVAQIEAAIEAAAKIKAEQAQQAERSKPYGGSFISHEEAQSVYYEALPNVGVMTEDMLKNKTELWNKYAKKNKDNPYQAYLDDVYEYYIKNAPQWHLDNAPTYHSGGFVGDLQSNEEFAKLMNGEFVSTPSQMQRFIDKTLPAIAGATNKSITYNAPLVTIECENITPEAIPDLERIVNQAVQKIKSEIDGAFSRVGFRKKI